MAVLRMNWHWLISIHKPASRAMLSECLMILDHLSREAISQQGFDWNFDTSNAVY